MPFLRSLLLLGLLFVSLSNFSQDISKYLDDGGFSKGSKIVKIGYDPLNGVIPIYFEHALNKKFSLEWEAGLVSIKRQNWLYGYDPLPIDPDGLGFTASVGFRIYLRTFPEPFYCTLRSGITSMSGTLFTDAISCSLGYQVPIKGRWMVDMEAGFGIRVFKDKMFEELDIIERDVRFTLPVSIKTGYMF